MAAKKNGSGIREVAPGKLRVTMYDPRVKGKTRHLATITYPPQAQTDANWYRTKRAAYRAAEDLKREEEKRRDLEAKGAGPGETIEQFATRWPTDYPRPQETTNRHNAERVKALIADFGNRPLRDGIKPIEARAWIFGGIVPDEIRAVAKGWQGAISRPGGEVEAKSRRSHHLAVRAMFNDALRTGLTNSNPFASLNVPEAQGRRGSAITILTEAELALLLETIEEVLGDYGIHFAALIKTLAWTGMRPGEAWALMIEKTSTYNYVDFDQGELHIRWQIDRYGKRRHPKWDKKGKGRVVYLLPPARAALEQAIEERPNGEVFYTTRGKPMTNGTAGYYWSKVRPVFWAKLPDERRSKLSEKQGGPEPGKIAIDFDIYECRHFFGTQLGTVMEMPAPYVANQLGHVDGGALAMERYIHPRQDDVKQAMMRKYEEAERRKAVGE